MVIWSMLSAAAFRSLFGYFHKYTPTQLKSEGCHGHDLSLICGTEFLKSIEDHWKVTLQKKPWSGVSPTVDCLVVADLNYVSFYP